MVFISAFSAFFAVKFVFLAGIAKKNLLEFLIRNPGGQEDIGKSGKWGIVNHREHIERKENACYKPRMTDGHGGGETWKIIFASPKAWFFLWVLCVLRLNESPVFPPGLCLHPLIHGNP
jgi:hypothetical protein